MHTVQKWKADATGEEEGKKTLFGKVREDVTQGV